MKQFSNIRKTICVGILSILTTAFTLAQNKVSDIDLDTDITAIDKGPFYAQLWFWVVIGMVFLLLLIALIRGNGGKREVEAEEEKK